MPGVSINRKSGELWCYNVINQNKLISSPAIEILVARFVPLIVPYLKPKLKKVIKNFNLEKFVKQSVLLSYC